MPRSWGRVRTCAVSTLTAGVVLAGFTAGASSAAAGTSATVPMGMRSGAVGTALAVRPVLGVGMSSVYVKAVQQKLHVTPASGYFGPITKAAVVKVQRAAHLPPTGIVDARTWAAIDRATRGTSRSRVVRSVASFAMRGRTVVRIAARYAGVRYVAGGTSPRTGFDCSGYTRYVYARIGISLPHQSRLQYARTHHISRARAVPGDLVFYYDGGRIHHVAIYAGNGQVWHSPQPGQRVKRERIWTSKIYFGRI